MHFDMHRNFFHICKRQKIFMRGVMVEWLEMLYYGVENVNPGPVVQSIVSLTSSLRGQLVRCFRTL